ncbi:MAG: S-layer family protein, partial [Cyanobacteria bacterium J083]
PNSEGSKVGQKNRKESKKGIEIGKELEINNGSNIVTLTSGSGKGADIDLNISNSLNIIGSDTVSLDTTITSIFQQSFQLSEDFSGVYSVTQGRGKAGDIEINTQKFSLENQATVFAPTFASGNSGNIMLNAQKVLIDDSAFLSFGSIESQGSVGDMTINTEQLLVQNGGLISTGTLGQGKGGDILINSSESVTLAKTPPGVRLPTGIYTNSIFNQAPAGNITINSPKLTIAGGAWLTSGSGLIITPDIFIPLGGKSGDITINSQKIRIAGISPDGLFTSRIFNDNAGRETAGDIYINTQILDILDNGSISTTSLGLGTGGNIFIEATESVNLVGNGFNQLQGIIDNILKTGNLEQIFFPGGIVTGSFQTGNSGHLTINTGQLNLTKGMAISTLSLGNGDSGNISIHTNEGINLSSSVINTSTAGEGIGGSIKLTTPELHIENGGSLTTVTFGSGDAGDVEILANNKVQISDLPRNSLSITGIATNTLGDSGNAGDVKIMTQSLILENGGTIIAETEESALPNSENPPGKGGNIFIHATDSIKLSGSTFSQIFGFVSSGLSTSTDSSASAGNLEIQTQELIVENGALIEVSSKGTGAAGDLKILAENIWLREQGNLSANTDSGRGGNIKLTALDSIYLDNSFISAKAFGIGRGGNIDINSQNLIVDRQSEITAEAIVGQGGNINVNSLILLLSTDSMITATSQLGIDGVININSLNPDQTIGAEKLAQSLLSTEDEVQSRCQSGENYTQATFIITGKGGLPNNPYQLPKRADLLLDLEDETELWEVHNSSSLPHSQLSSQWMEARGWYVNQAGKTILTSTNPPYPSFSLAPVSSCPKKMPYSYNPNK